MRIVRYVAPASMLYAVAVASQVVAQPSLSQAARASTAARELAPKATAVPPSRTGIFPTIIPQHLQSFDVSGKIGTYNPAAPTDTRTNPFFQSLGSNGRACVTCHEPRSAWSVGAASIQRRFRTSGGTDPIFRVNDGATCDNADVSSLAAKRRAYSLLLSKGLIRIALPLPATQLGSSPPLPRDFEIDAVNDPYGCTALSDNPPMISSYRRPLPAANLPFLTTCAPDDPGCAPLAIMWDGREPSLESQAIDATTGHAQAANAPSGDQVQAIVTFESNIFAAQESDRQAGRLDLDGANGGALALSEQEFFIGINDSLSSGFSDLVFDLYDAWQSSGGGEAARRKAAVRASIARGEDIFNTKTFTISDVNGLNLQATDPLGPAPVSGTCTTCHDSPNVGNHSLKLPLAIGVADATPPVLDVSGLPVFTVRCTETEGPLAGQVFQVTDLGRALITGSCADVGKMKGPILRGLAARAPYFHNGAAATLADVVNFYDQRFSIGLTDQEKEDLAAFLQTL